MSDIFVSRGIGGGPWVAESVQSKAASFTYLAHSLSSETYMASWGSQEAFPERSSIRVGVTHLYHWPFGITSTGLLIKAITSLPRSKRGDVDPVG